VLRLGVFERIVPLAPAGLARTGRGDLLTRLVRDVDDLQDLPLRVIQPLVSAVLIAALSVVVVWLILPVAGLTLLAALVLAALLGTFAAGRISARSERELAPLRGKLADEVLEVVENLDVLTAFGVLENRLASLRALDARLRTATLRRSFGVGVQGAVLSLLTGAAVVAALVGGIPALDGATGFGFTLSGLAVESDALRGTLFAVIVFVPIAVFEVFGMVPLALGSWRQVRASAERVATAVPAVVPAEIPVEVSTAAGSPARLPADTVVELRDLGASWPGGETPAVSGVNLRLAPGDRVHLSGASGAGKTTLAQVLVRFLEYTGSYRLGGIEARDLHQDQVRGLVGLCEQRPWLFDDSIRQNLLFAKDDATDDELLAVLDRVGLRDWALGRGGLDAQVGERGALVSGGQAQRIALARALLADFAVLIVDEPTANVDSGQSDRLVRDILTAAGTERAVLLISHTPVPAELITGRVVLGTS
jgi:ATP-binding cassette subfamily C protein CydC